MLLWLALALLAAATVGLIVWPLLAGRVRAVAAEDADLAVYRDQLAEIETEREQGLMGPSEAAAARAELGRRILVRAEAPAGSTVKSVAGGTSRRLGQILGASIPLAAFAIYALVGAPRLPDQPAAARAKLPGNQPSIAELITKVEARLAEHPDDAQGWDVIGPVYMLQQRYKEAAGAFAQSIRLNGETPKRLSGLAEASLSDSNGIVTETARRAFERLVALDPKRVEARYWLAVAKEQDGKLAAAADDLAALLGEASLDATARKATEERLAAIRMRLGPRAGDAGAAAPGRSGPSPGDAAAVAAMPEGERAAFVERMVSGLAERLKKDGKDVQGWVKLMRAYKVLGREKDAATALAEARKALADEPSALGEIETAAKGLGLGS